MRRLVPTTQVAVKVKQHMPKTWHLCPPPIPHLLGPVIHRLRVVYLLAKPGDHLGRCPLHTLGGDIGFRQRRLP